MYRHSVLIRGFTLIEVLTVIALISILTGLVARGGSPLKATVELDRQAQEIANLARTARQNAISAVEVGGTFPSYGVVFQEGPDATTPGMARIYSRTVSENNTLAIGDACYKVDGQTGQTDIRTHTFTGGVFIRDIAHINNNGGNQTFASDRYAVVFFQRPIPTTYMGRTNPSCQGGATTFQSGEMRITLENTSGQRRIVNINSSGRVDITLP